MRVLFSMYNKCRRTLRAMENDHILQALLHQATAPPRHMERYAKIILIVFILGQTGQLS